jgi:flagella basal body P-ring formation protein FlgA
VIVRIRPRSRAAGLGFGFMLALTAFGDALAQGGTSPVPRVTIYPGDVIGDNLLVERTLAPNALTQGRIFLDRKDLIGKVARQTLLPGQPIPVNAVREPQLVKQGQAVLVIFQTEDLVISSTAVPLQSGAVGDIISLRNSDSGATIRGIVQADGTIRVAGP